MTHQTRIVFFAVACLALMSLPAPCAAGEAGSAIVPVAGSLLGETGPMAVLGPMDMVRLVAGAKGKVVVLGFWASWCAPCRSEIPEFNEVRRAFSEDELVLVGLSVDEDPLAYSKFLSATEFAYPVRRVSEAVSQLYRIGTIPRLVVYNVQGQLTVSHEGVVEADDLKALVAKLLVEK